jgi:hypothetical protein
VRELSVHQSCGVNAALAWTAKFASPLALSVHDNPSWRPKKLGPNSRDPHRVPKHSRYDLKDLPARWVLYLSPSDKAVKRLVVFVHGYRGSAVGTWMNFPDLDFRCKLPRASTVAL